MNIVEFKSNFAFIYLNKNIYSKTAILNSFKVYKEFIDFIMLENERNNILKISLKSKDFTLNEIINELLNYIISEEYSEISKNGL